MSVVAKGVYCGWSKKSLASEGKTMDNVEPSSYHVWTGGASHSISRAGGGKSYNLWKAAELGGPCRQSIPETLKLSLPKEYME